jgi:mRNA interferase RelE/StbE
LSYEVRLSSAATRQLRKLDPKEQDGIRAALERIAGRPIGGRGGKALKMIHGRNDRFFRLRVGDYRVMFDVIETDQVILVFGVVHRRDLERWLRGQ